MTRTEYDSIAAERTCEHCGQVVALEHNPNNNAIQVICKSCGSRRPWGRVINLKQNTKTIRKPLPDGETLDSIWDKFGNRCMLCSAPQAALATLGIGRQVHHVAPYAQEGHRGPIVPICTHCHAVATERQRLYWFYQRVVMKSKDDRVADRDDNETNTAHQTPAS